MNSGAGTLTILTNNGSGGFALASSPIVGGGSRWVVAGDVNGDGKVDLITANYGSGNHSLTVLTNDGTGGFSRASSPVLSSAPYAVAAADVNGDGKLDLITANADGTMTVLTNNGVGAFAIASSANLNGNPRSITVFTNVDGNLNVVTANQYNNTLSVMTNNGHGTFALATLVTGANQPLMVSAVDVNGDAKIDLICANYGNNTLSVWTNDGSGGFAFSSSPAAGSLPFFVTTADVNGDNKQDLISANLGDNTLTVLTNNGKGFFATAVSLPVGSNPWSVGAADLNGDGKPDLFSANAGNSTITILTNATPFPDFLHGATATAIVSFGFVVNVEINDAGFGYTNTPMVRFIGGGGSGAGAVAAISNGMVISITITNNGAGYTNPPTVVIEPPVFSNPLLKIAPMSFLAFSNLTVGGTYQLQQLILWYWTNQAVNFTATNTVYTQMVAGVVSGGSRRLALSPVPAQAFATATVSYGFLVHATVTSSGSGYVISPAVTIIGGGGTNATAVAQISGGAVTNILITSAGTGYTSTPTIQIAQPPAAAVYPTVLPVMRLDSSIVAPLHTYQTQFKPNIVTSWVNWAGGSFIPLDVTNSQFLFITNDIGFFRLQFVQ